MHPLRQAIWGHIRKHTVEKSQTNVTNATMHPFEQTSLWNTWESIHKTRWLFRICPNKLPLWYPDVADNEDDIDPPESPSDCPALIFLVPVAGETEEAEEPWLAHRDAEVGIAWFWSLILVLESDFWSLIPILDSKEIKETGVVHCDSSIYASQRFCSRSVPVPFPLHSRSSSVPFPFLSCSIESNCNGTERKLKKSRWVDPLF